MKEGDVPEEKCFPGIFLRTKMFPEKEQKLQLTHGSQLLEMHASLLSRKQV